MATSFGWKKDEDHLALLRQNMNEPKKQRIRRRQLAVEQGLHLKRVPPPEPPPSPPVPVSVVDAQMQQSRMTLFQALSSGSEVVTNVERAAVARAWQVSHEVCQSSQRLSDAVAADAAECEARFAKISADWTPILAQHVAPEVLQQQVDEQMRSRDEVIAGKNQIIDALVREIDKTEKLYADNLIRQEKDVEMLVSRMETQYKIMQNLFLQEEAALELAVFEEHSDVLTKQCHDFAADMEKLQAVENKALDTRLEAKAMWQKDRDSVECGKYEDLRALREQLDEQVHACRVRLQDTKALTLVREEQLEYACYLLKKREEEYKSARAVNKRKRNRLQATVGELKNKLAAERSSEGEEITALKADLVKLRQSLVSLVSHSSSTSGTSSSASMSTEERNFRACCDLAWHKLRDDLRILQEKEQVIFKEFLGNPGGEQLTCWISSPIASAKKQVPTLTSGAELPLPEFQDPCAGEEGGDARISRLLSGVVDKKTRFILESLGARGEFLMDDALNQVLQESSESWADDNDSAQNNLKLSKLDSILQSLGVQDVIKLEHLLSCIEMGMGNRNWDGNLLSHAEIIQGIRRFCKTEESQQISINGRRPVLQSLLYTSRADAFMVPVVQELESHLEDASVLWNCIEEYLTKYMALLRSRSLCCKDMGTASLRNQQLLQILKIYLSSNTGLSVNRSDLGSILDSQGTRDAASLSVQAASLMDHTTKGL